MDKDGGRRITSFIISCLLLILGIVILVGVWNAVFSDNLVKLLNYNPDLSDYGGSPPGSYNTIEGISKVEFDGAERRYFIMSNGQEYELFFNEPPGDFISKKKITVKGNFISEDKTKLLVFELDYTK